MNHRKRLKLLEHDAHGTVEAFQVVEGRKDHAVGRKVHETLVVRAVLEALEVEAVDSVEGDRQDLATSTSSRLENALLELRTR